MSTEKRLVLFVVLAMASMAGMQLLLTRLGMMPKPEPPAEPPPVAQAAPEAQKKEAEAAKKGEDQPAPAVAAAPKPAAAEIKRYEPKDLILGEKDPASGYRVYFFVDQQGAGVHWLESPRFDAERVQGQPPSKLRLIDADPDAPHSFGINLASLGGDAAAVQADAQLALAGGLRLDRRLWEVVPDEKGRTVRPVMAKGQEGKDPVEIGRRLVFRATVGDPAIVVTKTYTVRKGEDGFELELSFASPAADRRVSYELEGPHGVPIEGDWYTGTFRDVFVKQAGNNVVTQTAYDIVRTAPKDRERFTKYPLAYAGVENQHFAVFYQPDPLPPDEKQRWDSETIPVVIREDKDDAQKSDASLATTSKEFAVGPNLTVTHRYRVFAGPKTREVLAGWGAEELASYRKGWQLPILGPIGAWVARNVIAPLLSRMYMVTAFVGGLFGAKQGNYGFAIIMLVVTVRLMLFPLSRKQAIMAKKMQDLQPHLAEMKEKYKDDKEAQMRETFALQRKHGVNMFGGCLPALIQIPIFIGLWQALNNSVDLRQAPFILWIKDLSAPDMLFRWPFNMIQVPLIGRMIGPYFNVLPLISAGLMLVHTKLFAPPATTPEAKMQQDMMKYMMVFMAVMLYRVPSGLGIYFITSSTWAICERLLLPKTFKVRKPAADDDKPGPGPGPDGRGGKGGGGPNGNGNGSPGGGWFAQLQAKMEKVLDEAAKDATHRKNVEKERERDKDKGREPAPGRPRPKSPPGRRR